jgi:hypothetical protein
MEGFIFLADAAEEINGKLYVLGGGWSRVHRGRDTFTVVVVGQVFVPWNQANRQLPIRLELLDGDGNPARVQETVIGTEGLLEVGRPPGVLEGSDLEVPIVIKFESLPIPFGRYKFVLSVAGELVAERTLDVLNPNP